MDMRRRIEWGSVYYLLVLVLNLGACWDLVLLLQCGVILDLGLLLDDGLLGLFYHSLLVDRLLLGDVLYLGGILDGFNG